MASYLGLMVVGLIILFTLGAVILVGLGIYFYRKSHRENLPGSMHETGAGHPHPD